jgi:hypothetical protein
MTPHKWGLVQGCEGLKFIDGSMTNDYICEICKIRVIGLNRDEKGKFYEAPGKHPYNLKGKYTEDCDLVVINGVHGL